MLLQQQRTGDSPPRRTRKRSGSTPHSLNYPMDNLPAPYSALRIPHSTSTTAAPASADPHSSATAPLHGLPPPSPPKPTLLHLPAQSEMGWIRRIYVVRLLYLLIQWCGSLWDSALGSMRHGSVPQYTGNAETEQEAETSADEKESDDDTSSSTSPMAGDTTVRRSSPTRRAPSLFTMTLRQRKSNSPSSPFGRTNVPPTVNLIPPPDDNNPNIQSVDDSVRRSALAVPSASPLSEVGSSGVTSAPGPSAPKSGLYFPKTLVLDLDETLIHSTTRPLFSAERGEGFFGLGRFFGRRAKSGHMVEVVMGGRSTLYHVYKRPFVDYFLRKVRCGVNYGPLSDFP